MMNQEDEALLLDESSIRSLQRVDNSDVDDVVDEEESLDELIKRYTSYKRRQQHDKDDSDESDSDDNEEDKHISKPFVKLKQPQLEAPEFIERLRGYNEASVGASVSFVAQFRAFPVPTVKWFKDEEEVCPTERHQLSFESEGTLRLIINDITATDEGAYKCKVENQEGVASTTGYLSVTGSDMRSRKTARSTSSRSNKVSPSPSRSRSPAVSSPPALRSIIEHRSIEESEEQELYRQPPSPLQSFIDNIRHSAKSRHPPIFYGTDDLLFGIIGDEEDVFQNETLASQSDRLERQATLTGDDDETMGGSSKLDIVNSRAVEDRTVNVQNYLVVPAAYISVNSNLSAHCEATTSARFDSVLDEDKSVMKTTSTEVPNSRTTTSTRSTELVVDEHRNFPSNFHQRRLGRLQQRLAIDIPDRHLSSKTVSDDETRCPEPISLTSNQCDKDSTCSSSMNPSQSTGSELKDNCDLTNVFLRVLLVMFDSQAVQLYAVLATVATLLANAFELPLSWLILVVATSSLVSFHLFEQHRAFSRASSKIETSTYSSLRNR